MRPCRILAALCFGALSALTGCGAKEQSAVTDPAAGAVDARGELLSYACQACHSLEAGEAHRVGPNLYGVFGRRAGTAPGFDYSPALRDLDLVWSADALERWLADPLGFAPGTTMAFTGYQDAGDRQALITYLERVTGPAPGTGTE